MRDPDFGDLKALRERMLKWAKGMTRGGCHAEDLVQSALLRIFANRHRFDAALGGVDQWAHTILINEFRRDGRQRRRVPVLVDYEQVPLMAADDPFAVVYCRQVCRMALGLDAAMLLAEPEVPENCTQRTRRRRARTRLEARVAA